MTRHDDPLVSCLMVTRSRLAMARRAIDCFASQTYTRRELVIVSDGEEEAPELHRYAAERWSGGLVVQAYARDSLPLGALRNVAVDLARGGAICHWDDDDLSHPLRLSTQMASMQAQRADACFMTDQLQLMTRSNSLYWCDWTRPRGCPLRWPTIPNTLLCRKACAPRYPERGPLSRRSEDAQCMRSLLQRTTVARLSGCGWLYVYVCHGANTWSESHHLDIIRATGLDADDLVQRRQELRDGLAGHGLGQLTMRDYLGAEVYRVGTPPR